MGLLDKLKDLFMDEVVDEDEFELEEENKNLYEEPKDVLPKVMRDTIKKEEASINFDDLKPLKDEKVKVTKEEPVIEKKFSIPFDFEEEVMPSRVANRNVMEVEQEVPKREKPVREIPQPKKEVVRKEEPKKVAELYPKKEVVVEKPKFKPTPVISPVYGILDKNYKKEEVIEKAEETVEMKRPSKSVDFETVRKKAFGNLVDEIKENLMCENCELYKEVKRISSISTEDLLYDMMVDDKKEEPITIEKAEDNYQDFGVAYEPKKELRRDIPVVENNTTIINNNTDVVIAEKIEIEEKKIENKNNEEKPVGFSDFRKVEVSHEVDNEEPMEIPSREEKKKDSKVDEDFFQLIDSMYKERIDE